MKRQIVKITESQLKKVIEGLINEQRSAGVNTGETATNKPVASGNKDEVYSSGPNNTGGEKTQYFYEFLKQSKLECIKNGNFEFGKDAQLGGYVKFYLSTDKTQYIKIYSNARCNIVMKGGDGKPVNKMGNAKCDSKGMVEILEGNKIMYIFNPKNPIKKDVNQNVINWQKKLIEAGYDLGPKGADGVWGKKTQEAYDAYIAREKRMTGKLPDSPQAKVAPLEVPTLKTDLGKIPAPTSPEAIKQAEQDKYFSDPGRQVFVDNINKSLFFRDAERKTLVWRGPKMNQNDLDNLTKYLSSKGYAYTRYRDRRDGDAAYVWKYGR